VTAAQFRTALGRLKLSQLGAGRLFGAESERTPRRWASGERSVPTSVAILLRLMIAGKVSVEDVQNASE
jgi:hypothetical protein